MTLRKIIKYWLYGSCPGIAGTFPYMGTRVHFPKGSLSFRAACEQGIFEIDNVRLLTRLTRPGTHYLDVGTNIGLMSIPVLKAAADVQVISFEASPNVLSHLARTIEESPYRDRWTLVSKAVGATVGKTSFSLSSRENSLFDGIKSTQQVAAVSQIEVEITTLDHWWLNASKPEISLIKCDVEGAELDVLRGAWQCLAGVRPHVLLEWNRHNLRAYDCKPDALFDFAVEADYSLYALPTLVKVDSGRELELQMTFTESFLLAPGRSR